MVFFLRRSVICLFLELFLIEIFDKIVFVLLYRFWVVSYLGDFGIVLIMKKLNVVGRVDVMVRYR